MILALIALAWLGRTGLTEHERRGWLWESWRFVKQTFPLLLVGVFFVGVFMYFPTLVSAIIGRVKAWTYVAWVALFSTAAGLIYGTWVVGTGPRAGADRQEATDVMSWRTRYL